MTARYTCKACGLACEKAYSVGARELNAPLCDTCAERMLACEHYSGAQHQRHDADGCGYTIWTCDDCGLTEYDDL